MMMVSMTKRLACFIALLVACAMPAVRTAQGQELVINGPAPDFSATIFGGREVSLADYKGQVLIINFWATWCGPCKEELPLLNNYYSAAKQRDYGLKILAITTEDSLPINTLTPLAAKVSFDMARHFHGPYRALKAVPTNYVIDRNGILRYAKADAFDLDSLNAVIIPLLQQPVPDGTAPGPTKASFDPGIHPLLASPIKGEGHEVLSPLP
jgi:cytochrome c biogenesis protein CcmG/thiol:disulfide interchange protein DsbE